MADKKIDTDTIDDGDAIYVRNEFGGVHSITGEQYKNELVLTLASGKQVLRPGWEEITEAAARKEHPQLFGGHDPNVVLNIKELQDLKARREIEAEFSGEAADSKSE